MNLSASEKRVWAVVTLAVILSGVCVATSMRALALAKTASSSGGGDMRDELAKLDKRIYSLGRRVATLQGTVRLAGSGSAAGSDMDPSRPAMGNAGTPRSGFPDGPPQPGQMGPGMNGASNLAQIAKAVGEMDPEVFRQLSRRHERQKSIAQYRQKALARVQRQKALDAEKYSGDARLMELYEAATDPNNENRSDALTTLLEDYNGASATGMALAEAALESAQVADTTSVEAYYKALTASDNYQDVVTESGVEAVPMLQSYLVRSYIESGQFEEAETVIKEMGDYADSFVSVQTPDGRMDWVSVDDIVAGASSAITGLQNGDASVLDAPPSSEPSMGVNAGSGGGAAAGGGGGSSSGSGGTAGSPGGGGSRTGTGAAGGPR